ncbi:MAG: alpha/beta fold hydrolase [Gammaproteobacteria bacterium]|nr:alpha/beta fold hydrolase [Gammaproteobacteria bacterium]
MISGIVSVVISMGLLSGLLYIMQPSLAFYPTRELVETPMMRGLEYEDVQINTRDGVRLHGWYVPHQEAEEVVLFLHGNGGNISHRGDSLKIFHRLGLNVFIFDYRGYGNSDGSPSEEGLYEDARTAWRYLIERRGFKREQIIIFGRSIGVAVATKLAVETGPEKVILESAFSNSRDMADRVMPLISRIVVMRYPFDSMVRIKDIKARLLMLHSPDDEIIPYRLGEKLYQAANEPKQFVKLKGDHNHGFMLSQPEYEQALDEFINTNRE